jgi:GT2 family glycosyltransferase/glycosyltransferase involved in cell wall biosynthesis
MKTLTIDLTPDFFFSSSHNPYYIYAPDFCQSSAGIRSLHYLCHALNEIGSEAYITAEVTSPHLRTPHLTDEVIEQHNLAQRTPIAVYPEIVSGNPLNALTVARWLLNKPGHIGGEIDFDPNELIFYYDHWILPQGIVGDMLWIPTIDRRIFNNLDNPLDNRRTGICYYANKFLVFGGEISAEIINLGTSLCHSIPRTHEEIAAILRQSKVLYCYEHSAIIQESLACGCPVIMVTSSYFKKTEWADAFGTRVDTNAIDLESLRAEIPDYHRVNNELVESSYTQLNAFVERTQSFSKEAKKFAYGHQLLSPGKISTRTAFQKWLDARQLFDSDVTNLANTMATQWPHSPKLHLLIRLEEQQGNELADTLDSLVRQTYQQWHLDILSTASAPPGLDELPCIDWHVLNSQSDAKSTADHLVTTQSLDLVVELPAGAMLDPLCLWRLADESNRHPEICAFFTDDYTFDKNGMCEHIRFKPGVNPEWLRSSDLAGPVFVRRDVWHSTEGASQPNGSPWFSQLLRIATKFGWSSIRHIPDVLISYLDNVPRETKSCLHGLVEDLNRKGIDGEIVPITGQSWSIRYPLSTSPNVSIAIISRGQLDLLSRCFNSIIEKTSYPNFEIVIVVPSAKNEPDLNSWLEGVEQSSAQTTRVIRTEKTANHANRCNAAVQASANDFTLLIREEAVVIQEKWLEELVRTCYQPDIAAVSPCLIAPGTSKIEEAGSVIGLTGLIGSPYQGEAKLGESGYLDCLRVAHDVSALSGACLLVRTAAYLMVGGMDETDLGNHFSDTDLCLKLRSPTQRLVYQPLATVVFGGATSLDIDGDFESQAKETLTKAHAAKVFSQRWLTHASVDPFWNPNLSLADVKPTPETDFHAQWQYLPSSAPRVLARNFWKGESFFRIDSALVLSRKAGLATECYWPQDKREPCAAELLRLAPDTVIVHQYLKNPQLAALQDWTTLPDRPFVVYTIDDLMTDMAKSNALRTNIPANSQTRLKYALERCDRLVTSTDFLSESYRHFIADIRVVPNRLVGETWLPLQSQKRTGKKPRIGWAGGRTHLDDLLLLKEVIEQTRSEADWVLFGMCPDDMRPLVAEYHPYTTLTEYPGQLAALNLDIAVAPLAQTAFNQAKSNLRLLEYGILGIPVVCTDIDPYRGSPACCVANTTGAWTKALRARIHDANARGREGAALRQWVHQGYLLENHLEEWLAAHLPNRPQ